ncbi:LCP family protein [Glycomyces sp. NRRL B-16210]|uniref:LCP family protein n=1 Tax=Glycomyces sp. NRRL B-16210 TaxID=1463821 RepID=UPI0004C069B3|nr:LCP family protein [Glycomyces sp. NRRL B-16210]
MARKGRAPWWAYTMLYVGALAFVVAGGLAAAGQYAIHTANGALQREDLLGGHRAEVEDPVRLSGPLDFLILGVDHVDGLRRTDTVMMAHVDADLDKVYLVSIPRDLWVAIPDCGWGGGPCEFKLNHAGTVGDRGHALNNLNETLYDLSGLRFHGAATANFEGFIDLVDVVGEIELCLWHEIASGDRVYPEGCAYYGKDDALFLVRERKQWDRDSDWAEGRGGDYGRIKMQQQAVGSILAEAGKQGHLTDTGKAMALLEGFSGNLTADLGEIDPADLLVAMRGVDPRETVAIDVPSSPEEITWEGAPLSIVRIHEGEERAAADALWEAIAEDALEEWTARYPQWVAGG